MQLLKNCKSCCLPKLALTKHNWIMQPEFVDVCYLSGAVISECIGMGPLQCFIFRSQGQTYFFERNPTTSNAFESTDRAGFAE